MFTCVYLFAIVYSCTFTYVYISLHLFTPVYACLPMLMCLHLFTPVYLCSIMFTHACLRMFTSCLPMFIVV